MFDRLVPEPLAAAATAHLQADGVVRGAIVAWLGHNSWDMLATLVACRRLGAVLLPLNWRLSAAELAYIVQHAGAGHLLGTPEMQDLAVDVLGRVQLAAGAADGVLTGDLLLVYTSGTTGQPKGAMHTAAGLQANALAAITAQSFTPADVVLSTLPVFHVGGLCIQTLPALAVGAKVLLHPRFDPGLWFDAVQRDRPSTTLLVPAMMRALVDHPRWGTADLSSLRFVNTGSQIVPPQLIQTFHDRGVPVAQVYGCTESGPVSIVLRPEDALKHPGRSGSAALGVQVRLAADGEILLKGANMMRAYHREAAPAFDAQGWFHTGDLACLHADGFYEVVGRSKELIISGGENIHPAEIENLLVGVPGIAEAAVVGVPDARWGEVPVLALVPLPGQTIDLDALRQIFNDHLAHFKHPRRIVIQPELPKTALGKVQKTRLAQQLAAPPATP